MSNEIDLEKWWEEVRLHRAAQDGNLEEVESLIESGYPPNQFDDIGKTPLHYAAEREHLLVMKALLDSGAEVNAHNESQISNTPLGDVAGNCSLAVAKILVDAGADPTIPGWMQLTALHKSQKRKRGEGPKVHELLVERRRNLKGSNLRR